MKRTNSHVMPEPPQRGAANALDSAARLPPAPIDSAQAAMPIVDTWPDAGAQAAMPAASVWSASSTQAASLARTDGDAWGEALGSSATTPPGVGLQGESALPPESERNLEELLGRSAIGIVASVLVFAGLALFGANVIPQLPDTLKVALMFAVSGMLAVTGSLLAMLRRNNFTLALMGCGMGSLFISVIATHVYFGLIGEIPAYGLILAWMAACLALMRKTDSLLIAIVLQLGLACSVCLGYGSSLEGGKLALVVGYQVAASTVVVGGNLLFCRKLYRTSLFLALCLGVAASLCLWNHFGVDLAMWAQSYSLAWVCVSFAVQFVAAAILCVLLVVSIGREWHALVSAHDQGLCDDDVPGDGLQAKPAAFPVKPRLQMVAAAVLAVLATRLDVYNVVERCVRAGVFGNPHTFETGYLCSIVLATGAMVAVLALMMAAIVYCARGRAGEGGARLLSAVFVGAIREEDAFRLANPALWTLLVGSACALSYLVPAFDHAIDAPSLSWMWVAALCAFALWRGTRTTAFRGGCLAFLGLDACFFVISGFSKFAVQLDALSAAVMGAVYVIGLGVAAGAIVFSMKPDSAGIVSFAAACTCLLMSYLYHCTPLAGEGYQWSLCCMAFALVCIIGGFALRVGGLRLYGLVLVLLCVGKLALFDLVGLDPLVRVLALVAGGVICFVISGLYNFVAKRLAQA